MIRLHKIAAGFLAFVVIASCNKYKTSEFSVDKPDNVAAQEDIDAYPALKSYINRVAHPDLSWGWHWVYKSTSIKG